MYHNPLTLIESYTMGMSLDDFKKDRKTADAVLRNFEIIGEALKYIPEEIKKKYENIDWRGFIGLRNIITHAYFNISHDIIWQILKNEVPRLKESIEEIRVILKTGQI